MKRSVVTPEAEVVVQAGRGPKGLSPIDEIVIPVQGSDREFYAQQWAVELSAAFNLPLRALHVNASGHEAPRDIFRYLRKISEKWGISHEERVVDGANVIEELLRELSPRNLVVIGSHKMAHSFHIGSVAEELVRRAPCPIYVVRIG